MIDPIPLAHALYVSRAAPAVQLPDVQRIALMAERRNWSRGITGTLLYTGRHFVQWIEGPVPAVQALLGRIAADHRHEAVITVRSGPLAKRRFAEWGMRLMHDPLLARQLEALDATGTLDETGREHLAERIVAAFIASNAESADSYRVTGLGPLSEA